MNTDTMEVITDTSALLKLGFDTFVHFGEKHPLEAGDYYVQMGRVYKSASSQISKEKIAYPVIKDDEKTFYLTGETRRLNPGEWGRAESGFVFYWQESVNLPTKKRYRVLKPLPETKEEEVTDEEAPTTQEPTTLQRVVSLMQKEGWVDTAEENLLETLKEILYEHEEMTSELHEIRSILKRRAV